MLSHGRLGEFLSLTGLIILFLLAFQTLSGTTIQVGSDITMDSAYIIALIDAAVVYFGLKFHSREGSKAGSKSSGVLEALFLGTGVVLISALALGFSFLLLTIPAVPWDTVYWFDPSLNFQLIKSYFPNNSFVSFILILMLVLILAEKNLNPNQSQMEEESKR